MACRPCAALAFGHTCDGHVRAAAPHGTPQTIHHTHPTQWHATCHCTLSCRPMCFACLCLVHFRLTQRQDGAFYLTFAQRSRALRSRASHIPSLLSIFLSLLPARA